MPRKKAARFYPKRESARIRRASSLADVQKFGSDDNSEENSTSEIEEAQIKSRPATSAAHDDLSSEPRQTRARAATTSRQWSPRSRTESRSPGGSSRVTSAPSSDRRRKRSAPDNDKGESAADNGSATNKRVKRAVSMSDVPRPVKRGPGRPRKYPRSSSVSKNGLASTSHSPGSVAIDEDSLVRVTKASDSVTTHLDRESSASSSSANDIEEDETYNGNGRTMKTRMRTHQVQPEDNDGDADETDTVTQNAEDIEDGAIDDQADSDRDDPVDNGLEDVLMDDASNVDGAEEGDEPDEVDDEADEDSSGTPKLNKTGDNLQAGEESDAVRSTAPTRPGKAIRRLPGRRRAPHANPVVEAAIRRQLHLRMRFRAVVKGLKPILGELAKRSIHDLDTDVTALEKNPAHSIVLNDLDECLDDRHELLETQFRLENDHLRQTLEANQQAVRESAVHAIAEVRDQLIHAVWHDMVKVWRKMHVHENEDLEATDDEGDGVIQPLRQKVRSQLGVFLGPEYDSRSRVMIESKQQYDRYITRTTVLDEQSDWDYESTELPSLPHTWIDPTWRERTITDRRVRLLIKAGKAMDKQVQQSHVSNSQAKGLQLLAGISERATPASQPLYGDVQKRTASDLVSLSGPERGGRPKSSPTLQKIEFMPGVVARQENRDKRPDHGDKSMPRRRESSHGHVPPGLHSSDFHGNSIGTDNHVVQHGGSAQRSWDAHPSGYAQSRQPDHRYSSTVDRDRYHAHYPRPSPQTGSAVQRRPSQSTYTGAMRPPTSDVRPQHHTGYDRSWQQASPRQGEPRYATDRHRGNPSSPYATQGHNWPQDQSQARASTDHARRGSAASRDYEDYQRRAGGHLPQRGPFHHAQAYRHPQHAQAPGHPHQREQIPQARYEHATRKEPPGSATLGSPFLERRTFDRGPMSAQTTSPQMTRQDNRYDKGLRHNDEYEAHRNSGTISHDATRRTYEPDTHARNPR